MHFDDEPDDEEVQRASPLMTRLQWVVLEDGEYPRTERARDYVWQVKVIEVRSGLLSAEVAGGSLYTVRIGADPLTYAQWTGIAAAVATDPALRRRLAAGRIPHGKLDPALDPLVPSGGIGGACNCPDYAWCKHVMATGLHLAERAETDVDCLLRWRGGSLDRLMADATRLERILPKRQTWPASA